MTQEQKLSQIKQLLLAIDEKCKKDKEVSSWVYRAVRLIDAHSRVSSSWKEINKLNYECETA